MTPFYIRDFNVENLYDMTQKRELEPSVDEHNWVKWTFK